jgi:tRNA(Arg) A34 adenosine deaminase TadA
MHDYRRKFMRAAIRLARKGMNKNSGGPFGCVITRNGKIIARAHNSVTDLNDPTAHAEVVAIRKACRKLKSFQLSGCEIYASCEPCPMCFGAIYWARPDKVYYAATREDAAGAGFDDDFIYHEIDLSPSQRRIPFESMQSIEALTVFDEWKLKPDKTAY